MQSDEELEPGGEVCPLGQSSQAVRLLLANLPAAHKLQFVRPGVSCFPAGHGMQLLLVWLLLGW